MNEEKKQPKRLFRVEITRKIYLRVLVWARNEWEAESIAEEYDLADDADEMDRTDVAEEADEADYLKGNKAFDADAGEWLDTPTEEVEK